YGEENMMRAMRCVCAIAAGALILGSSSAFAQENTQALRQEIDQLRREFETLKQQYGDRLTALELKLAAAGGAPPPAAPAQPPAAGEPALPGQPGAAQQPSALVPPGAEGAGGPTGTLPVYGGAVAS